ncbi:MAG: hypothetical protein ACRDVP_06940 [Acidimicrobiales bacterium]
MAPPARSSGLEVTMGDETRTMKASDLDLTDTEALDGWLDRRVAREYGRRLLGQTRHAQLALLRSLAEDLEAELAHMATLGAEGGKNRSVLDEAIAQNTAALGVVQKKLEVLASSG